MQGSIPSTDMRPRFVDHAGNVLDQELVNSIRKQAQFPEDPQIHDLLSRCEHNTLAVSAMGRLYDAEKDTSCPWLALILDDVARSTYEIARQPKPTNIVKYRQDNKKPRNDGEKLLRDIRTLRTNMFLNCSMEDETRRVSPWDASSTAGKVDLGLIGLECELDEEGKAMDIGADDVPVDLPLSVKLLCNSILNQYQKASGKKSELIKKTKLFHFDIDAVLADKPVRYSNVPHLLKGLPKLYIRLSEDDGSIDDIRNAVWLIDKYGQLFFDALQDLRMFVDRQPFTRNNTELSHILVSLLNDISCVRSRIAKSLALTESPDAREALVAILDTLYDEALDCVGRINRLPMRTGREGNQIRLQQLIRILRFWHLGLTGDRRRYTIITPDKGASDLEKITKGPFFNFVEAVGTVLGFEFTDNTLRKAISQTLHELEGTDANPILRTKK